MKTISALWAIVFLSGCSTAQYVLHERPKAGAFSGTSLRAPIEFSGKVALLYDREPWVMVEGKMADGSVWVHYAVTIKNAGDSTVYLMSQKVRLEGTGLEAVPAEFSLEDKVAAKEPIESGTYYRVTVKFRLPEAWVEKATNQEDGLNLLVPVDSQELKLKLWLWKV